jgi:hypothetical protein
MKSTPGASARIERARKDGIKIVDIYPCTGRLTEERADEIIRSFGGLPVTPEESRMFRKFIKNPYP